MKWYVYVKATFPYKDKLVIHTTRNASNLQSELDARINVTPQESMILYTFFSRVGDRQGTLNHDGRDDEVGFSLLSTRYPPHR